MILMINLLIAMLTNTFDKVREEATLQSRLSFATNVMKLELLADALGWDTRVGTPHPRNPSSGTYVYKFRAYERRENDESEDEDGYEGDFDEGGSDPFLAPVSSQQTRMFLYIKELRSTVEGRLSALEQQISDLSGGASKSQRSTRPSKEEVSRKPSGVLSTMPPLVLDTPRSTNRAASTTVVDLDDAAVATAAAPAHAQPNGAHHAPDDVGDGAATDADEVVPVDDA